MRCYHLPDEQLYADYLFGKQTIQQLSVSYHLSARQIQRRLNGSFGQQLLAIANGMTHTDRESYEGALTEWFEHWNSYINERTTSDNVQSFYTHRRLRTAARSLRRNMDVLWTFYTYPELKLPNTNNAMESFWRIGQLSLRG